MINPHLFRDLFLMERHIVDVSRLAEGLRRYTDGVEAAGGDASRLRDSLLQMLLALDTLRTQRNEIAHQVRKIGDRSWVSTTSAASPDIHIVDDGVPL